MFIKKRLTCSITIKDPNDIYNPDPDSVIKRHLEERFKGKCYKSCLILEIIEIVKRGHLEFSRQLNAHVNVNVCFDVKAVVYHTDEVIHKCKVINIQDNNFIVCQSEYAVIHLQKNLRIDDSNISNIFKVNQEIPIIVKRTRYDIDKKMITVSGVIYIPYPEKLIVYKVRPPLTDQKEQKSGPTETKEIDVTNDNQRKLEILQSKIKAEEDLHDKLKAKKEYKFFQTIMYPYKTQQKFSLSPLSRLYKFKEISIDDLTKHKAPFTLAYPDSYHRTDKIVCIGEEKDVDVVKDDSDSKDNNIEAMVMEIDYYDILMIVYRKYLDHLTRLRLFYEQMDSLEKIKEYSIYWKIIESRKS